jgi:patatin-like phospholipase/acyl hydrolase
MRSVSGWAAAPTQTDRNTKADRAFGEGNDDMRRVLCIDGGGIKGAFPASFLATVEDALQKPVSRFFDLIVGTSTGGIIALGLGLGFSARQMLKFYEESGPTIFGGNAGVRRLRRLFRAKYEPAALRTALQNVFGERLIGDSATRLVIPSFNVETGEVHVWKTSHHPRLEHDYKHRAVEAALSTAAAPTYFPTHLTTAGIPLIDGGVWANNPVAIAMVEAMGVLKWDAAEIQILSLGCTTPPLAVNWGRKHSLGIAGWSRKIVDVFMTAQSASATGMAQHLLADRNQLIRISPVVGQGRFDPDKVDGIPVLRGLGDSEARKALPELRKRFFDLPEAELFIPSHDLRGLRPAATDPATVGNR